MHTDQSDLVKFTARNSSMNINRNIEPDGNINDYGRMCSTKPELVEDRPLKNYYNKDKSKNHFYTTEAPEIDKINKEFKDLETQKLELMYKLDSLYKSELLNPSESSKPRTKFKKALYEFSESSNSSHNSDIVENSEISKLITFDPVNERENSEVKMEDVTYRSK